MSRLKDISDVSLDDVRLARGLMQEIVLKTPIRKIVEALPFDPEGEIFVKLENMQRMGSFKIRGALNKLSHLTEDERSKGVIACSAGNHAQGVAFSAKRLGVKSTIVMPVGSPLVKVAATQSMGAEVVLHGDYFDQSQEKAREIQKEQGLTFVHPYEDPYVIAGQGTLALEILEDLPDLKNILVPIGGGGLIGGVALAIKALRPECRVLGVVSDAAPGMERWFKGQPFTSSPQRPTIADGIAVKKPSRAMFDHFISKYVDDIVEVSDEEIARAIVFLLEKVKTVTEGSGAAAFAALLAKKFKLEKGSTCVLLCGGNIDLNTMSRVIETGLRQAGRLSRISVVVHDLPGSLLSVTDVLARQGSNILDVFHDRVSPDLELRETRIDFVVELRNHDHLKRILEELSQLKGMKSVKVP